MLSGIWASQGLQPSCAGSDGKGTTSTGSASTHPIGMARRPDTQDTASGRVKAMKIKLDSGASIPVRAHDTDAGADLRPPVGTVIPAGCPCIIDTGVHIRLPHGHVGMPKGRSGLNVRHGIASDGVIDGGHTGSIAVKPCNHGDRPCKIERGDKITQPAAVPCEYVDLGAVDRLDDSERGGDGFGPTGRQRRPRVKIGRKWAGSIWAATRRRHTGREPCMPSTGCLHRSQ